LEAILNCLPQDLDKQLKGIQADIRTMRTAAQNDQEAAAVQVQDGFRSLQKELQQARLESSSSVAALEQEVRMLQQAVGSAVKDMVTTTNQQSADLMTAVERLSGYPEVEAIAGGVAERLQKMTLRTDNAPVLAALECVPDMHQRVCHMHEKVSESNIHYDPSDILKAVHKIKPAPDHATIAAAVHEKLAKANIKVDTSDLARALERIDVDRSLEAQSGLIEERLRKHSGDVLKAVANLPGHETIVNAMHERLKTMTMNVDHGDLMQAIRKIPTEQDHERTAQAVHDRIGQALLNAGNHSRILSAIGALRLDPDLSVVLEAIEALEGSMFSTVSEAIRGIDMQVMCRGSMPPVTSPMLQNGAWKVRQGYTSKQRTPVALPDVSTAPSSPEQSSTKSSLGDITPRSPSQPRPEKCASARPSMSTMVRPQTPTMERPVEVAARDVAISLNTSMAAITCMACTCGFSCGTQSAMSRHLERFAGQKGHKQVSG